MFTGPLGNGTQAAGPIEATLGRKAAATGGDSTQAVGRIENMFAQLPGQEG